MGEYAVLDGSPAIVLAINRGVRCDFTVGGVDQHIETPDGDTRFVAPPLATAPPGRYRFQAWNPVDLPSKPGFGGSAAACVAACVAAGRPAVDALSIHHEVQGSGSGIDVLAGIHGGMGRVEHQRWSALPPLIPVVTFAGRSARTGPRVERYRGWQGSERRDFADRSRALVDNFASDPIAAFRAAWRLLVRMADITGIAYTTPELEAIVREAEAVGGGAKASGAGGGDCTVALFDNDRSAARFREAMEHLGLRCIPVLPAAGAQLVTS